MEFPIRSDLAGAVSQPITRLGRVRRLLTVTHMADSQDSIDPSPSISRRGFLGSLAVAAGTPWLRADDSERKEEERLMVPIGTPPSRVIEVRSSYVVQGSTVHPQVLREMLAKTLTALTEKPTAQAAWQSILTPRDIVGLKFNRSGQTLLGTAPPFAEALIESLMDAGIAPENIVCMEEPDGLAARYGTTCPTCGFDKVPTEFGSGRDHLASVLDQVTAIISVPFLKTHNIAGLTCSLKNLSHALVKHPARYHAGGCSPYIADIVSIPRIRSKLRVCVVNALRIVFDKGPEGQGDTISDEGLILGSFDPVAIDAVGLEVLNKTRRERSLEPVTLSGRFVPFLRAAHLRGLGVAVSHGIKKIECSL